MQKQEQMQQALRYNNAVRYPVLLYQTFFFVVVCCCWFSYFLVTIFPWKNQTINSLHITRVFQIVIAKFLETFSWVFNPLHPKIRMHILHTALNTFPKEKTRRICLPIKSFISWWSFSLFSWPKCVNWGWYCKEKLDACHSQGSKG